jgi:hypothetical protein
MDQERPMKKKLTAHIIPALLALIVFFTTAPFVESMLRFNSRQTAAIDWKSVKTLTPTVRPGEVLSVAYSATINKQCPSDLRGFLVAPDGTVPVRFPVVAGGYRIPSDGPVDIPVKVVIPRTSDPGLAPLVSGQYVYRSLATRYCADGVEEDHSVPEAKFFLEIP